MDGPLNAVRPPYFMQIACQVPDRTDYRVCRQAVIGRGVLACIFEVLNSKNYPVSAAQPSADPPHMTVKTLIHGRTSYEACIKALHPDPETFATRSDISMGFCRKAETSSVPLCWRILVSE